MRLSRSLVCAVRPSTRPLDQPDAEDEEWEEILASGVLDDEPQMVPAGVRDEVDINADTGEQTLPARCIPWAGSQPPAAAG